MSDPGVRPHSARKQALRQRMESARARTLQLLEETPDAYFQTRVHSFYSPVGWHFGHIGMTEEAWVCEEALRRPCNDSALRFLFANIPENPKDNRVHLPTRQQIAAYLARTRERTLEALETTNIDTESPLLADGYAWEFALQHECQHQETIVELLQLITLRSAVRVEASFGRDDGLLHPAPPTALAIPGGRFLMGTNSRHVYDNEQRSHEAEVAPFNLEAEPVSAAHWLCFMRDGGYRRPELWSAEGWRWRQEENASAPEYWIPTEDGQAFAYAGPRGVRQIDSSEPASSVSWYEADAYARWAGRRLPTEPEWECAFQSMAEVPGSVWQWTASPFLPYPGFRAFPYDGYSLEHMDGRHYVCRGGSWATDALIRRPTFRNWYVPSYRQGLLGVRCAL